MTYRLVVGCLPLLLSVSCLEPTNPCDPDAPLSAKSVTLTGSVRDVYGEPQAGVVVSIAGRPETTVSGADGRYTLADLPATTNGYQVVATPAAPAIGGVRSVPASLLSSCGNSTKEVELVIAQAAAAPEAELVRAVDPTTLLVAFSAERILTPQKGPRNIVDSGEPIPSDFGGTEDAVESSGIWDGPQQSPPEDVQGDLDANDDTGGADEPAKESVFFDGNVPLEESTYTNNCAADAANEPFGEWRKVRLSIDPWRNDAGTSMSTVADRCAAATCSQFTHLAPELANNRARCALVVGFDDNSPLEPYGTYEVRVQSEARLIPALTTEQALPAVVRSALSTKRLSTSLVPSALIDVVNENASSMSDDMRTKDINTVLPLTDGRFAVYAEDTMRVIGDALDTMASEANLNDNGRAADSMGSDGTTANVIIEETWRNEFELQPLASVLKDDGLVVYTLLGKFELDGRLSEVVLREARLPTANDPNPPSQELMINFKNHLDPTLLDRMLDIVVLPSPDQQIESFVAVFPRFLLRFAQLRVAGSGLSTPQTLADLRGAVGVPDGILIPQDPTNPCGALGIELDGTTASGDGLQVLLSALTCYPITENNNERTVLKAGPVLPDGERQMMVRAGGNSVMTVNLLNGNVINERSVGALPTDAKFSTMLNCDDFSLHEDVLVVANRDSRDLSILSRDAGGVERSVVTLPIAPIAIVRGSPSCDNPFLWVIGAEGDMVPVNMTKLGDSVRGVPDCGGASCVVPTRGRARVGAASGSKVVVGGAGLVGEVGFFRPKSPFGTVADLAVASDP
jgi:hypothetical protein